jgi:hypothetical protein
VVWALGSSRHSLIRANAGRYFDRVPLRALANALLSAGNTNRSWKPAADRRHARPNADWRTGVSRHPP